MNRYPTAFNREPRFASAIATALSLFVLFAPALARASDSVERWNIAMTDFSAGQLPPGIPPMVEARGYAMAHIAMLQALRTARANVNPANANAAIAAAAHGVLTSVFAPFGPNPFDSVYQAELAAIPNGPAETRGVSIGDARDPGGRGHIRRAGCTVYARHGAGRLPGDASHERHRRRRLVRAENLRRAVAAAVPRAPRHPGPASRAPASSPRVSHPADCAGRSSRCRTSQ